MGTDCIKEMMIIVNKTYKVSGRIMIQDGKGSHIRRFKDELEHNGTMGDSELELKVLKNFALDIKEEMTQTTLEVQAGQESEKKSLAAEKKTKPEKSG